MSNPSFADLFTKEPLYTKYELGDELAKCVFNIRLWPGTVDCNCPSCGRDGTYHHILNETVKNRHGDDIMFRLTGGNHRELINYCFEERFVCARCAEHQLIVYFIAHGGSLIKTGQYPSIADLENSDIKKYKKVLGEQFFAELARSTGLKAHGIGVGSFVYLRRIFEKLIEDAHQILRKNADWDEDEYNRLRVDEKILKLQSELPVFLVENRSLYGILSKGVHELTEDECLRYFETVKIGIEIILDEIISKREKEEKIVQAKKEIGQITGEVRR